MNFHAVLSTSILVVIAVMSSTGAAAPILSSEDVRIFEFHKILSSYRRTIALRPIDRRRFPDDYSLFSFIDLKLI